MITAPSRSGDVYLVTRGFFYFISYVILLRKGVCSRQGFSRKQWSWILINAFAPQFTHSNRRPVLFTEPALYIHLSSQLTPCLPQCIWNSTSSSIMLTNKAVFKLWTLVLIDCAAECGACTLWVSVKDRAVSCVTTHTQLSHQLFFFWRRRNVSRVSSPISSLLLTYKKEWFDWFKLYEWQNDLCIVETGFQVATLYQKIYLGI